MEADRVLLLEGLTQVVAGLEAKHGGVLSVDSQMGSAAGVGGFAFVLDGFGHAAVVADSASEVDVIARVGAVNHHGNVDVIKIAPGHEFYLTAHVADYALLAQILAECKLDHFFGRHGHKPDRTRKSVQSAGLLHGGGYA